MSTDEPDDNKVGYGKPPKRTRWKNGESGNPERQHPKRVETTVELIDRYLLKPIEITISDKSRRVTTLEAILLRLSQKEVQGDPRALKIRLKLEEFARRHAKPRVETVFVDTEYTKAFAAIPLKDNKSDE